MNEVLLTTAKPEPLSRIFTNGWFKIPVVQQIRLLAR
jgi:hypothetical protein